MREILFRGKRVDNGAWETGSLVIVRMDLHDAQYFIADKMTGYHTPVEKSTIGQYIGLTDKNGKRIFEGDIVHYSYEPGEGYWNSDQNSVIEWKSTGFYMRGIMGTNKYACSTDWLVSIPHGDGSCFEVVGNIYDNPELLKGGEQ